MKNKQYSIGEFASINKVSTRMLRHYDKIGLLQPASILSNGYRCYSEKQIGAISRIKQLRGCGFLLDEIDAIMQNENPQFLAEESRHKLTELQGQAVQKQTEIQALSELMQENIRVTSPFIYGVSRSVRHGINLLTPKKMIIIDDVIMERYFIDSSHGATPNEFVTEVSVALRIPLDINTVSRGILYVWIKEEGV